MGIGRGKPTVIIGGGPAGSVAAICLRKLGREVVLFERLTFPRYRIGESLLPGTMSILSRLGVMEKVHAAGFTKKRAATFVWGGGRPPWTFSFATPRTEPWTYDYALQVTRAEFDQILLTTAHERGATVHEGHEVTDVALAGSDAAVTVSWQRPDAQGSLDAAFVIDASGERGVVAKKLGLRQWDHYYRNMAVWSYWRGGKRFRGALEGNIFSATWKEGWIWIIPLKDDTYSVGVVTGTDASATMREIGPQAFYLQALHSCHLATEILASAEQTEEVRVLRDWSYEARQFALGLAFLSGDSACFIDPLFSQGVHLATYSASLAAAAIDHLYDHPGDIEEVGAWYDRSYRAAYSRYHRFLAAFYAFNGEADSRFWSSRKIADDTDERLNGKAWVSGLSATASEPGAPEGTGVVQGAATLAQLWQHGSPDLNDEYDNTELSLRRVQWARRLLREVRALARITWAGAEVRLVPSFKVNQLSFKLERVCHLGDERGRTVTAYALGEAHRALFESLITQPLSYEKLSARLKELDQHGNPLLLIRRFLEDGLLQGYDQDGNPARITSPMRFGGVGADDDIS